MSASATITISVKQYAALKRLQGVAEGIITSGQSYTQQVCNALREALEMVEEASK